MLKRVGESRHPCWTPTVVRNKSPRLLLKRIALVALPWRLLMTRIRLVLMLYFLMVAHKADFVLFHGCQHRQNKTKKNNNKKAWVTAEIVDLCDRRRKLRKKRFEPEGSEKCREVINNIMKCTKKAKENWIGEQCSEIEVNLRKNNSKRAYQLVKDLTTVKQWKVITVQDRSGKCFTEEQQILN